MGGNTGYNNNKTETATNITIQKITEIVEYNTILEVTDDYGSIHLLINIKCTLTVVDPGFPIWNKPHSTSLFFCEKNVGYYQYNIESATDHDF